MPGSVRLSFDLGTLLVQGVPHEAARSLPGVLWDERTGGFRAPAWRYRDLRAGLQGWDVDDRIGSSLARAEASWAPFELRPYQSGALLAWQMADERGLVVLPTGSGKTRLALAAMRASAPSNVLCLVPTRVLLHQWANELRRYYAGEVGLWGDGHHDTKPITVATFESGLRYASRIGGRFDLLVVDEVHHFGDRRRDEALEMCVARRRLGLTATLPGDEVQLARLRELIGEVTFERSIADLSGSYLAAFDVVVLRAALTSDERRRYREEHGAFSRAYRAFLRMCPGAGWPEFVASASRSEDGCRALASWREARRIAAFPEAKNVLLGELVSKHRANRLLVFTPDNASAYRIAREHLIMPLTCDIRREERDEALARFRSGALRALVSSRVLNEGLDVPDAEVAVIVGGTLGEREHIQRVGRLLRPSPGKRAMVYELVSAGTSEVRSADRRRQALVNPTPALG